MPVRAYGVHSIASEVGHAHVVTALLRARANVDAQKNDDSTPLIAASYFGRAVIVELLLDAGAKLDLRDSDGTAFDNAWKQKHDAVCTLLKQAERTQATREALGQLEDDVEDEVEAGRDGDAEGADAAEVEEDVGAGSEGDDDDEAEEVEESMGQVPSPTRPKVNSLGVVSTGTVQRPMSAKALKKPPPNAEPNATTARYRSTTSGKGRGAGGDERSGGNERDGEGHRSGSSSGTAGHRSVRTAADPQAAAAVAAAVAAAGSQAEFQRSQQQQDRESRMREAEAKLAEAKRKQQEAAAAAAKRKELEAARQRQQVEAENSAAAAAAEARLAQARLLPAQRAQARVAEWAEAEAGVAAALRKLEQRTGLADEGDDDDGDDDDDSDADFDIDKLRRQAKERITLQEGRSAYATRAGESTGVRMLEARLKGAAREYHPPVGATQWVDENEAAAEAASPAREVEGGAES